MVADRVVVVNTAEVVDTDLLVHSSSVRLVQALPLSDYHSLHRNAFLVHSADHSLRRLRERLEPSGELALACYVHNGRRKQSQREPARGRQDRDGS
jgi:hypothetical protein